MEQECESEGSNINISDVIEVIQTDPEFGPEMMDRNRRGLEGPGPSIRIIEQPAPKALRFRYECEGRSAGSIPGVNSTPENKTYPTIKIDNYRGRAMVLVSCVTKDPPYRAHPHNLVGKERCKKGVCTVEVDSETMTATFSNLGIQCVKKKDIEQALTERENLRIDPFKNGFAHKTQSGMIDLNAVRLCFQVFLEGPGRNEFKRPIHPPIVSDPIFDKKAMSDLVITKLSDCSASVAGGKDIILLCEKVDKDEVKVRFYEEKDNCIVWEGWGDFLPQNVHKQVAIPFTTPRYKTFQVEYPVKVFIQLVLKKDDKITSASAPLPFLLTPLDADRDRLTPKKRKLDPSSQALFRHMQETEHTLRLQNVNVPPDTTVVKHEPYYGKSPHHQSPMPSPTYAGLPNYSPSVYQPPAQPVLQDCYSAMNDIYGQPAQGPFSPRSPLQQPVDIQMSSDVQHLPLHQLEISGLSTQHNVMRQNVLSPMQISDIPLQNVLQPTSGLNTPVQINQLSPQPQNIMPQQLPPQPESDELNTPTVSATGIGERNNGNDVYHHDSEQMGQLTSGDLASILGGLQDTSNLPQNVSFE